MSSDLLERAVELRAKGKPFVLATVVAYRRPQSAKPGSKAIIAPDGTVTGWVGGGCVQPIVIREALKVLEGGKPNLIIISPDSTHQGWEGVREYLMTCQGGGSLEIYLDPVLPKPELLIFGTSPVAQTISHIGKVLDFHVTVADPNATTAQFPDAAIHSDVSAVKHLISDRTYIVIATMGDGDEEALMAAAGADAAYIGFVASREKSGKLFEYLRQKGVQDADLKKIKSPAGLELGAESLPEIAFSVLAEIVQINNQNRKHAKSEGKPAFTIPVIQPQNAVDPICGMKVDTTKAKYVSAYENKTYYFCCLHCKETFEGSPAQYAK